MRTEIRPTTAAKADTVDLRHAHMLTVARTLSWIVAAVVFAAALASEVARELYVDETPWAREAFRGGDLVTLLVAVPLLVASLVLVARGSVRAIPVWIGVLFYTLYMYAYAVFGATFNDAFLLHIAAFSLSMFALGCALPAIDLDAVAQEFAGNRWAKAVGIFMVIVGAGQGALWVFVVVRNAVSGELIENIPVSGQHLVFALDLSLLVPMLIVSGVLLARRRPSGFLLGTAMAVMGAITQLNLNVAAIFQANADVVGAKRLPAEGVLLTLTFVAAALAMVLGGHTRGGIPASPE
jgi:hypothetical protein